MSLTVPPPSVLPPAQDRPLADAALDAVTMLLNGFVGHPANSRLRRKLAVGQLTPRQVHLAVVRLVLRQVLEGDGPSLPSFSDEYASPAARFLEACALDEDDRTAFVEGLAATGLADADELGDVYLTLRARSAHYAPSTATFTLERATVEDRRASGSFYTPEAVVTVLLDRALTPLLDQAVDHEDAVAAVSALRVCDPACGSGDVLIAAGRRVAARLCELDLPPEEAAGIAFSTCLYAVDADPIALELCRLRLWIESGRSEAAVLAARRTTRWGDALVGLPFGSVAPSAGQTGPAEDTQLSLLGDAPPATAEEATREAEAFLRDHLGPERGVPALHWRHVFADVFDAGGFDLVIGNPPWIAHAGRAARPLSAGRKAFFAATNPAFAGYRTTHGMFVYRGVQLLRPRGRLAFILPTSVADLDGYAPARQAHDTLARPLIPLRDFGDDVFPGVFQPCMALISIRHDEQQATPSGIWELEREDLGDTARRLLRRLAEHPTVPPELFGERGIQTVDGRKSMREGVDPEGQFTFGMRSGSEVGAYELRAIRWYADPAAFSPANTADERWRSVDIVIRQTARTPLAAVNDGAPFRNSLLAGFEQAEWPAAGLVALLNSSLARFHHHARFRDARQGMPQVKVGHLRAIPRPPDLALVAMLAALSDAWPPAELPTAAALRHVDDLVFGAYALTEAEREAVHAWNEEHGISPFVLDQAGAESAAA